MDIAHGTKTTATPAQPGMVELAIELVKALRCTDIPAERAIILRALDMCCSPTVVSDLKLDPRLERWLSSTF